ncbi:hypothetical protein CPB83DRAFT_807158 [Crepidotus variabilis]|uniref:Fork-head domain-containing protein n=1 Tax=Crepidotus variabilis TaxID=179855 RepID=A0A9P6EPT1_9AGAR|nr:hypothetical protein CPB83DRAFT_807158 [Crepidotus variabilis]
MYAPSPAGSDSSLEESSGSAYSSSHSQSPSSLGPTPISMALPTNQETEEYLRRTLEIPPHLPIDLRALPEPTEKKQPPITHMIKLAIWGSKHKRLTLRQIYDEVERRYPSLKDLQDKPWQRSIRHNLSLKAIFVRVERPTSDPGKGHYWAVDIRQGEGNKRDRKRKDTSGRASTSRSEDDEEFSEETEDDRSSFVMLGGRHGDRRGMSSLTTAHFR